ncbi:alpha-E domain-containing protein [Marinomonas algicola]|uniref:alpha-E domain-containing protein n=1 Tax=Marinomonas algicola TaxID=2773454 RepID=UPI00174BC5B3|nr:alpha-E domain-containing protein [Marinomonas algicola]
MLSRVAERIYWSARYVERVENIARLVSVYDNMMYDLPKGVDISWYNLVKINGSTELFHERYKVQDEKNVLKFMLEDDTNSSSMLSSLKMVRENIRTTRDVVPEATWELINELDIYARTNIKKGINRSDRHTFLTRIIEGCQTINGLLAGTMSRDATWQFVLLGRNVERSDMTTRVLDAAVSLMLQHQEEERLALAQVLWSKVLKSQSAYLNYRRTVRTSISGAKVARFMLNDAYFPRSVSFCFDEMLLAVNKLPHGDAVLESLNALKEMDFEITSSDDLDMKFRDYLNELQIGIIQLSSNITESWFSFDKGEAA